ncbi:MAG: thermosome subunit beta [Candidatus Heimdallarchaeota archaeon]
MAAQLGGTPVLILKEGTERTRGKDATSVNIQAARVIADSIRSALGPRGMDKMLVDNFGDVVITNDGATILKEIDVQHPVAKFVVELAKSQDDEVGDGTTTVVIIAGEFLKQAERLLELDVHPTVIVEGLRKATEKAMELIDVNSRRVTIDDVSELKKVAMTAMASKVVVGSSDYLSDLVVKAVRSVATQRDEKWKVDIDDIAMTKKEGESLEDTILVTGLVIDKEVVHAQMPKTMKHAKIALLAGALEITKTEFDAKINITSADQMKLFLDREQSLLSEMVDVIKNAGTTVAFCQKGIDDLVQHYLARAGILAIRRVKKSDMDKLAKATGGKIITNVRELDAEDLGSADIVEERKIGDDKMVFIEGAPEAKAISLLIRGGTELVIDEAERALHDAIMVVRDVVEDEKVVAGGGAIEAELAAEISKWSATFSGKEQLAIEGFAKSLEIIPTTLAENAGLDPIDIMVELRSKHESDGSTWGVDILNGRVADMGNTNVVEPAAVKRQAISAASEAAQMILRIDDVIAAKELEGGGGPPGGGPPGMEGEGEFD